MLIKDVMTRDLLVVAPDATLEPELTDARSLLAGLAHEAGLGEDVDTHAGELFARTGGRSRHPRRATRQGER